MKALDGVGREHEEFRLRLDKERDVELEAIRVRKDMAAVPGQGARARPSATRSSTSSAATAQFFERFVKAVTVGHVDGRRPGSRRGAPHGALSRYLTGEKDLLGGSEGDPLQARASRNDAQNLAVAALLHRMATNAPAPQAAAQTQAPVVEGSARPASAEKTQG